jgi:hypothetical protein
LQPQLWLSSPSAPTFPDSRRRLLRLQETSCRREIYYRGSGSARGDEGSVRIVDVATIPGIDLAHEVNAVLRHMRVRAMLSAEDEELIRKYLAP